MSNRTSFRYTCGYLFSFLLIGVLFGISLTYAAPSKQLTNIHRIVAVGDIHGDSEKFFDLLVRAQLADKDEDDKVHWAPSWKYKDAGDDSDYSVKTTLVQMGDLTDRGEDDLNAMLIAFRLYEQIKYNTSEDDILLLLGNHELLNVQGHFHYVASNNGGFVSKHVRQMAFEGPFGKAITEKFKMVDVIERTLFVHAGFADHTKLEDVDTINKKTQTALSEKKFSEPLLSSSGPVWTRKMIFDAMRDNCDSIHKILSFFVRRSHCCRSYTATVWAH
ncbi:serine/threonine protein phosphatase [Strigomonas culicis]|uniref:Serine/threonine protein phosphatase n=1 Tax=Strigomonas culicis TaxID=28005 RepID=S9TRI1_9TRYP|nr:serine/threonine protein phosphatase [Strigomonas culicis]|eukprot:EPY19209.1 serine/threonine protein phosphatase [Strigomonas culicis]